MWINITKEIFDNADFKSLNFLYQILSWYPDGSSIRYNIVVDTAKVKESDNFKKLSSVENNLEEFLDIEYAYFVTLPLSVSHKITPQKAQNNFNIEEAILFFSQSVSIVLENNKNDSQFIRAIITHFGKIEGKNKAQEHLDNGWLQFENGGGCSNIPNFIEEFLEKFRKIANKNQRKISDYFRGIIIIDSDKEFEQQPSKHNSLIKKLEELGIDSSKIHILEKRMMENYLPKEVFEDIKRQSVIQKNTELKDWLDVYVSLNDKQMDYINISAGFPPNEGKHGPGGKRKPIDKNIESLFALNPTDINFRKLDKGFKFKGFDEKGNLKTGSSFKDEFPNLFRKPIINKQNLKARDGNGELQQIVSKINQLL
jgi:hypothetical protein